MARAQYRMSPEALRTKLQHAKVVAELELDWERAEDTRRLKGKNKNIFMFMAVMATENFGKISSIGAIDRLEKDETTVDRGRPQPVLWRGERL
ncbi:MAG: hypothetical protein ABJL67_05105 [Sulfitobacter sp.]